MTETRASDASGRMSVGAIEHELARLRMNDDGTIGLRASVLNLVVVTSEEAAPAVTELVSGLSGRFPCRAIVFISEPEAPHDDFDVGLAAFCSTRGGGQVCAEQITIHACGAPARHLESLAEPLLIPDLPVFLFYPDEFDPDAGEFGSMVSLADRLIVDSGRASDPEGFLRRVALLAEEPGVPDLGDLEWVALSPWRALLADMFSPPERAGMLDEIERVRMVHDGGGEGRARALLFAGWLAASLGWEPEEGGSFSGPGGGIEVLFEESRGAPLRRVEISVRDLVFRVSRCRDAAEFRAEVERGGEILAGRTVHLGYSSVEEILGEELQHRGDDRNLLDALKVVGKMVER